MLKGVDIIEKEYKGNKIYILRIANLYAWLVKINDKTYGTYVEIGDYSEEDILHILELHYKKTIDELI